MPKPATSLVPATAVSAQEVEPEFEAELEALNTAVGDLEGETVEDWEAAKGGVDEALAALKSAAADLDYAEFDAAVADLEAAIAAGDLAEIAVAAEALAPAVAALEAQAGDDTEAPTVVDTGSEVSEGPNVALLGAAGFLALLTAGALALRRVPAGR